MSEKFRINAFYNGVSTFKAAFPDLGDALVEWREYTGPSDPKQPEIRKTGFRRGNFTQGVLRCSNPACYEGGYQADRLIADMLRQGEMEREGIMLCSGREIGDEVRRGPVRCPHRILYRVTLTPKAGEERPEHTERSHHKSRFRRGRGRSKRGSAA